jgi:hypothetical protein
MSALGGLDIPMKQTSFGNAEAFFCAVDVIWDV